VVRTRTTVDVEALRVRTAWGFQRLAWDDLATLRVVERGWVRAVRGDESELALVGVRTRDLGRVAQASGGRITMPTPEEVEDAAAHQRELEATRMRIARLREAEQETDQQTGQQTDGDAADATPGEGSERA
jgi:Bacterial PH domain